MTKLDLKASFNLIRIKNSDEWKTAYGLVYGHYEYTAMSFGLANAAATLQNMMNEILKDMSNYVIVIYLDGILIYSSSEEDHIALTKKVLERLKDYQLALSPEKCEWHMSIVNFLGYISSDNDIEMDQEKIRTMLEWKERTTV